MRLRRTYLCLSILAVAFFFVAGASSCAGQTVASITATDDAIKADTALPTAMKDEKEMSEEARSMPEKRMVEADKLVLDDVALAKTKKVSDGEEADSQASIEGAQKLTLQSDLRVRAPELLARLDKPDNEPLPLAGHDISVVVAGHRARVMYDMVFTNPTDRELSGTLMIDLPQGASPCYLGMFQGTPVRKDKDTQPTPAALLPPQPPAAEKLLAPEPAFERTWQAPGGMVDWGELRAARVINPVQGREVYEKTVRRRVDPALAEWAGGNKFSTRVFPIPPRGFKRVIFGYDRPLALIDGRFTFPLPVPAEIKAPTRLSLHLVSGTGTTGALLAAGREIAPRITASGSVWQMAVDASLKGTLVFTGAPQRRTVSVLAGSDPELKGKLIHLLYAPEIKKAADEVLTGRAVFLLDTSLSGKDKLYRRSGELLKAILESDTSLTEYAIIIFDVRARAWTGGFVKNTAQNRGTLFRSLEGLWLEGATNLSSALSLAATDPAFSGADTYFFLSDGQITWGNDNPADLATAFPALLDKRWICYTFGDEAVNRPLFEALTKQRGQIVQAGAAQDLMKAARAHRQAAVALDSVFGQNQEEIIVAGDPRLLYPGQVLEIACRTRTDRTAVRLVVSINGRKETVEVDAAENKLSAALAARAWAEVYANRLLDLRDDAANAHVLALSQHFALSNREASFIILETDAEYVRHKIDSAALDFAEIAHLAHERKTRFPSGSPDASDLGEETLKLLGLLKNAKSAPNWNAPAAVRLSGSAALILTPPAHRPKETTVALYTWAQELRKSGAGDDPRRLETALRALSSIVELKPQDDQALRLTGYVLLEWSLYGEAAELFGLVRRRRPFEPQNYLLEGLALALDGKTEEAALRFEIVLARDFPRLGDYAKPVAQILYAQLLQTVVTTSPVGRSLTLAVNRLDSLKPVSLPRGRLVLFWNLDDTDVDLHVTEPSGEEVYYEHEDSRTGGKLFWDNTEGLGPELYEHPALHQAGFDVFVNYFGSSSVEGAAPAATLVCAFTRRGRGATYELRFYTTALVGTKEDKVLIMPKWRP
jgi:hypothetical protein